jgi:rhodanese-related sulfurtransferase/predicted transcriptional regulator
MPVRSAKPTKSIKSTRADSAGLPGFKRLLFGQFALLAKALGHAARLELIEALGQGERPVEALARAAGLSIANASQHLQRLSRAGLVETRKAGPQVFYRLADEAVIALLDLLRQLADRRLAEVGRLVETWLADKDRLEPLSGQALRRRMRAGDVTLLDVRPEEEYAAGHLKGALNIPLSDLESRIATLPTTGEIVAYCRGPYCVLAYDAVALLRARGFRALRLEYGYPEGRAAGLPVAMT